MARISLQLQQYLKHGKHIKLTLSVEPSVHMRCLGILSSQQPKGKVAVSNSVTVLGLCEIAGCSIGGCSKPVGSSGISEVKHNRVSLCCSLQILK